MGSAYAHEPAQPGEAARYFGHTGGNWGFRSNLEAVNTTACKRCCSSRAAFSHRWRAVLQEIEGGKGLVIMANSGESNPIIFGELATRIKEQYAW